MHCLMLVCPGMLLRLLGIRVGRPYLYADTTLPGHRSWLVLGDRTCALAEYPRQLVVLPTPGRQPPFPLRGLDYSSPRCLVVVRVDRFNKREKLGRMAPAEHWPEGVQCLHGSRCRRFSSVRLVPESLWLCVCVFLYVPRTLHAYCDQSVQETLSSLLPGPGNDASSTCLIIEIRFAALLFRHRRELVLAANYYEVAQHTTSSSAVVCFVQSLAILSATTTGLFLAIRSRPARL